jgi:3-oxoacyl-[acyl-carrier protein] reductase
MQERGYGRIVNIASIAAIGTALPGTTFYAATKAEVLSLTRRFAMELGRRGITVNAVAPGWIVTEMARAGGGEEEFQVASAQYERAHHGRPDGAAGRYCQSGGVPGIAGVGVRDSAGAHD